MKMSRQFFDPRFQLREHRQSHVLACILFWSVLSYVAISRVLVNGAEVQGHSMMPTLADGDRVFLNLWLYRIVDPHRGDVIALDVPGYDGASVKRVVALPGETVQVRDGAVFVNGHELDEPYLPPGIITRSGALSTNVYQVADDCYFVLGDNRDDSLDSRRFGAVSRSWIRGRVAGLGFAEFRY
ncbi:MAG: signal peptidase I [Lentisphaerae bacterium]|nr:signal peptidase I [Lentisphaerota bacterium]